MKMKKSQLKTPPGVLLTNPKHAHNVATVIRSCSCFGIKELVWTGKRVDPAYYDRLPREERMKGYSNVNWQMTERPFDLFPDAVPVCVDLLTNAGNIKYFEHPKNALYVFGPEDGSVSQMFRRHCHHFIFIPSAHCLNLSAAVNIVLFDRVIKLDENTPTRPSDSLIEHRGEMEGFDWDGKDAK